jgi:serine/threonine-protein kinase RsbW/stage II sporulation protein AB (anti-sigma F factor)
VAAGPNRIHELREGIESAGLLVYERIAPAVPGSVGRVRGELGDVLARLHVGRDRRADIALVVSEAATNVVMHAYVERTCGPLYAAATLVGRQLRVTVADCGRGPIPHPDSPGVGLGLGVMAKLTDGLELSPNPCGSGTRMVATFERALPERHHSRITHRSSVVQRAEVLCDYARALMTTSAALHDDARAVLAQSGRTLARSRRPGYGRPGRAR